MAFGSFQKAVEAASQRLLKSLNDEIYRRARELFIRVIDETPSPANPGYWAKGYLVNQWYTATNGFSQQIDSSTSDYGAASYSRVESLIGTVFLGKDGQVSLTNNVSYIMKAEKTGWYDGRQNTGPYRMVAKALVWIGNKYK